MATDSDLVRNLIASVRPYNMLSGAFPFWIGTVVGSRPVVADILVGTSLMLLAMAFATIENDLADQVIDRVNAPERAITSRAVEPIVAERAALWILSLVLILSLFHFPHHVLPALVLLGASWLYNRPPVRLSYHPLGSITLLALLYGPLPLLYGYSLGNRGAIPIGIWLLALAWFAVRWSIAVLKDYKDARGDRQFDKRTFYLTYGGRATALVSLVVSTLGYIGILVTLVQLHGSVWPAVLLAFLAAWLVGQRVRLLTEPSEAGLARRFLVIFFRQNLFDLGVLLWLGFSK